MIVDGLDPLIRILETDGSLTVVPTRGTIGGPRPTKR